MSIDVYTPWRESAEALEARTVGRADVLRSLRDGGQDHLGGGQPLHRYVFGPRGSGKSRVLALVVPELLTGARAAGRQLLLLGEDTPEVASADDLWARLRPVSAHASWETRGRPAEPPVDSDGAIVVVEGLDRQLGALRPTERKRLRKLVQEHRVWVVGTGVSLVDTLTRKSGAFYGSFSPWPLEPLTDEESSALLGRMVPEQAQAARSWPARRHALVELAGGSPRTLVALAGSCAQRPEAWAADHLHAVVQQFTAHYQMRFRDLNPTGQRVLEQITLASGALSPTEVAAALGHDSRSIGVAMRRLLDDGVLTVRHEGRSAMYTVAEPLFRFWYEYRTAPWAETRVGWLAHLIEEVLAPPELVAAWLDNPDRQLWEPLERVLQRRMDVRVPAWLELFKRAADCTQGGADWVALVDRGKRLLPNATGERGDLVGVACVGVREASSAKLMLEVVGGDPNLARLEAVLAFSATLADGGAPRAALRALLSSDLPQLDSESRFWGLLAWLVLPEALDALYRRTPHGRSWKLSPSERRALARIPFLRARFLVRGKFTSHDPLLEPDDVLGAGTPVELDAWMLLGSAHERQHGPLFDAALRHCTSLPPCARPAVTAPAAHEAIARLSAQMMRDGDDAEWAWSWAASWAAATDDAFAALLDAAQTAPDLAEERGANTGAAAVLGLQAFGRLEALGHAVTRPVLSRSLARAAALARLLGERPPEDLHIELRSFLGLTVPGRVAGPP